MRLPDYLETLVREGEDRRFGQLILSRCGETGAFRAIHEDDRDRPAAELTELNSLPEVREIANQDDAGNYRPLKTAPTLRSGWTFVRPDAGSFLRFLDAIYPGAFGVSIRYLEGELDPVPLRLTLDRQTGLYRRAGTITDNQANEVMREVCAKGCLRAIAWPIDDTCPTGRIRMQDLRIPLICHEACTFVVSESRRLAREAYARANAPRPKKEEG